MSAIPAPPMLDEFLSFILERPTAQQILAYKVSTEVQARITELVERNSEGSLSEIEQQELQEHVEFDRMMSLLKAKALAAIYDHAADS